MNSRPSIIRRILSGVSCTDGVVVVNTSRVPAPLRTALSWAALVNDGMPLAEVPAKCYGLYRPLISLIASCARRMNPAQGSGSEISRVKRGASSGEP